MMGRRRAFTLAEVLVAAALTVLLLGLITQLFLSLRLTWDRGELRQQSVRESIVVTSRLRADFRDSKPGQAQLTQQGSDWMLSFPSCAGSGESPGTLWSDKGQILWRKWVIYRYHGETHSLFRREVARPAVEAEVSEAPPAWVEDSANHRLSEHLSQWQMSLQGEQLQATGLIRLESASSPIYLQIYPQLYGLDLL